MINDNKKPPLKYTQPDHFTLQETFKAYASLDSFITWKPEYSATQNKWLKVPLQKINKPEQHMLFNQVSSLGQPIGLVCNEHHSLIALDIDGVDPVKYPTLGQFIIQHPTYEEASPSGLPHRRRRIYSLINKNEKEKLATRATHPYDESEISLYSSGASYVTLTGHDTNHQPINLITPEDLTSLWPEFKTRKKDNLIEHPTKHIHGISPRTLATLTRPSDWIKLVPCDPDHPLVKTFCAINGYAYYDYWLLGIMTIHYSFSAAEAFAYADEWSRKSPDYNHEELQQKWQTLTTNKAYTITEKTYQWMFDQFNISWPVVHGKTKQPIHSEYQNFRALLKFYNIQIKVDGLTKTIYIEGPDAVVYSDYYKSQSDEWGIKDADLTRLSSRFMDICRRHKLRPSTFDIKTHIKTIVGLVQPKHQEVRFAKAVTSLGQYDPKTEPDYLTIIAEDVLIRNPEKIFPSPELHATLVRKWMLSMGRTLWPSKFSGTTAEGILILSGRQGGIGKSTFGRRIFPKEWRHLHIQVKPRLSGFSEDKDYKMKTTTTLLVDYDEAERITGSNKDADLKSELTAHDDSFRPPYGDTVQKFPRRYSHMASTNEDTLIIPREGTRRYWWLNIVDVDLDALDDIDKYRLWAQIKYEIQNHKGKRAPWLLTSKEQKELHENLAPHRTENRWEMALMEHYDFSTEGWQNKDNIVQEKNFDISNSRPLTWHVSGSITQISQEMGEPIVHPGLKHALTSLLRQHAPKEYFISKTLVREGQFTWRKQVRYYLPVPRSTF